MKKQNQTTETIQPEIKLTNIVGLWCNLARIYEVAKLGNFSITVVYQSDYPEAKDDYLEIKKFYIDAVFSSDGDLICEIAKPYEYNPKRNYETITDINNRIDAVKNNTKPTQFQSDACNALLKTATERLKFSLTDVKKVNEIASVIAQLSQSDEIKTEHIAEAVQYRAFMHSEIAIIAENNVLTFGDSIQIVMTEIDLEHIDAAIAYLQKMK